MKADHFLVSSDGALYDTREIEWSKKDPLRSTYEYHFSTIKNTQQLRATIRAGKYTDLGGYPLYLFTNCGAALCFDCAKSEYKRIAYDFKDGHNSGWLVAGCGVNYEDESLYCDHCNNQIKPAYGGDDE